MPDSQVKASPSFQRGFKLSLFLHSAFFMVLAILALIPLENRARNITWVAPDLEVMVKATPAPLTEEKVRGEKRDLEPENARPRPTPTPKPVAAPTPRIERPDEIKVAKTTPKPEHKKVTENWKKPVSTPTPKPQATPAPRKTPQTVMKTTPAPTPKMIARATPSRTPTPAPAPKGNPDADATAPAVPDDTFMQTDVDVALPYRYQVEARDAFSRNFVYPDRFANLSPPEICTIQFKIRQNGQLYDIQVSRSTGKTGLDRYALEAIRRTGRLQPLPTSIDRPYITATLKFSFGRSQGR